ncbi:hypothetical protein [Pseudoalteromonas sp. T1lg21]|uniref:hypothetical protein n=1 Tax=Pseudoalteromonas sp. T1lg21 TaxID=2077095 RepID=UPI000CF729E7|nr:hypothetical protein [Pseudoalteromonas sp. T1lg21]
MQNQAFQHRALNKTVEVQVVNPENGNVSAFRVKSISEPGFETVDIFPAQIRNEVLVAAIEAKAELDSIKEKTNANPDLVTKARRLYDFPSYARLNLEKIPVTVVSSAREIALGNIHHIAVSQYLDDQIGIPSNLKDLIVTLTLTYTITFFEDGSVMLFIPKPWSTIKWEVFGGTILDGNGNVLSISGGSSSSGGSSNTSGSNGTSTIVISSGTEWCFVQQGHPTYCWME